MGLGLHKVEIFTAYILFAYYGGCYFLLVGQKSVKFVYASLSNV